MSLPRAPDAGVRRHRRHALVTGAFSLAITVWSVGPASAVEARRAEAPPPLQSPDPVAYLVTVGPGDAVWERFGHSLLWIHDPEAGTDLAYNYGLFSFEQEHFLLRFVMGHMDYWMAGFDVQRQIAAYRSQNRSIELQELALAPDQVRELQAFLKWNALPENRTYRYHYYRDNCSTRVRDAIDRVLGGQLGPWARARSTDASYRDHTLRLTHDQFWASVGMDFGLGPSADVPLTASQAMFIPMEMASELRRFSVRTQGGDTVPLIRAERVLYTASRPPIPDRTPRRMGTFALAGGVIGALFWWLGRRRSVSGLLVLGIPWLVLAGLLGSLLAFLWAFTGHVDAAWNANLLQASPLHLALALVLVPFARGRAWARKAGRWIAASAAVLACLGLAVAIATAALPVVHQGNAPYLALLLPPNLAVAWAVWRMPERSQIRPGRKGGVTDGDKRRRKHTGRRT
jgi:hypothetical protein